MRMVSRDEKAVLQLRALYENFGYSRYKMSRFEEYELYVSNKDFLVSDAVITFSDRSGRLLALKPDVTLSIIKNVADTGRVQKLYYDENVYRIARGAQSFQEIMQVGLECIGDLTEYDVAEVVLLALRSLSMISGSYILDISHMGLIYEVLEQSGLSSAGVEHALACLREKCVHELIALCREENISREAEGKLTALIACCGTPRTVLDQLEQILNTPAEKKILNKLECLCAILVDCGFDSGLRLDFSVVNDLKYYSGVVFKGYVEGLPSSILCGGQYDALLRKMGRKSQAIGFAVYADQLARLDHEKSGYDVDTLLLYDRAADPSVVMAAAKEAEKQGSVLVCTAMPENRTWRRLLRLENGRMVNYG